MIGALARNGSGVQARLVSDGEQAPAMGNETRADETREDRLRRQLRENLKRRKAQARALRDDARPAPEAPEGPKAPDDTEDADRSD